MSKSVYLKCSDILDTWWGADLKLLHLSGLASSCEKMFVLNTFLVCLNLHLSKSAEYALACYYANPDFWVDSFTRKVPTLLKGRGEVWGPSAQPPCHLSGSVCGVATEHDRNLNWFPQC